MAGSLQSEGTKTAEKMVLGHTLEPGQAATHTQGSTVWTRNLRRLAAPGKLQGRREPWSWELRAVKLGLWMTR